MGGGGGGKGGGSKSGSASSTQVAEAPKPIQNEKDMTEAGQTARDRQKEMAKAALGQQSTINTSPFGSQENTQEQRRTLLGGNG
jgi:hypothetical protein